MDRTPREEAEAAYNTFMALPGSGAAYAGEPYFREGFIEGYIAASEADSGR